MAPAPEACRSAVEAADRSADGGGTAEEQACGVLLARSILGHAITGEVLAEREGRYAFQDPARWKGYLTHAMDGGRFRANVLRDLFGPLPFRPVEIPAAALTWGDRCVVRLATGIYEDRDFSSERMGVLVDALEDASVTDAEVLAHLRGPGPHILGCWCVDLILGKQ